MSKQLFDLFQEDEGVAVFHHNELALPMDTRKGTFCSRQAADAFKTHGLAAPPKTATPPCCIPA